MKRQQLNQEIHEIASHGGNNNGTYPYYYIKRQATLGCVIPHVVRKDAHSNDDSTQMLMRTLEK